MQSKLFSMLTRISKLPKASPKEESSSRSSEESSESEDESESEEANKYECIFCDYTSESSHEMNDHLQTHVPSEPGSFTLDLNKAAEKRKKWNLGWCEDCKKLFMDIASHIRTVHQYESLICPVCNKVVKHRSYQRHIAIHGDVKEMDFHSCTECPAIFRFKSLLKQHVRNSHIPPKKKHECETCGEEL